MNVTWKGSPNFDKNRTPIDRVVLHWFGAGTLESANTTFQKTGGTSAHYGISDDRIWQWVKEEDVSYHAGNYIMNQRSIGIEHDANPDKPASELTYKFSSQLLAEICKKYSIPLDRQHILQHKEIKATQCPGTLDIDRIINMAKAILSPPQPEPCVITDSTKIPQIENREVQEIKSSLFAKDMSLKDKENRILNLESTVTALNSTIEGLQYKLDHLPPNSSQALFIQLHDVIWGKGFWWTKWAKIKELLPR